MSRADALRAARDAEIAVIELEDQLAAAKATVPRCDGCGRRMPGEPADLTDLKQRVRDARQRFRAAREGGATASPDAVRVAADVSSLGG